MKTECSNKPQEIAIDKIEPDPYNPNIMDPESYRQLKEDMKNGKYYDPVEVREIGTNKFMVVDGNHRLKIAKELGWKTINCVVLNVNEFDARLRTLKKHIHRGQRNPIGIAENINDLRKKGYPLDGIASLLNFKIRHAYELLEILDLEDDLKELVRSGALSLKHVNVTSPLKKFHWTYKSAVLREAAKNRWTAKETRQRVEQIEAAIRFNLRFHSHYLIELEDDILIGWRWTDESPYVYTPEKNAICICLPKDVFERGVKKCEKYGLNFWATMYAFLKLYGEEKFCPVCEKMLDEPSNGKGFCSTCERLIIQETKALMEECFLEEEG